MNAWKGWLAKHALGTGNVTSRRMLKDDRPVLVIDASDFPEGYPMIGREWMWNGGVVTVRTNPYKLQGAGLCVTVDEGGTVRHVFLCDLSPIPKQATGEVVGTVEVTLEDPGWKVSGPVLRGEPGTYRIIK